MLTTLLWYVFDGLFHLSTSLCIHSYVCSICHLICISRVFMACRALPVITFNACLNIHYIFLCHVCVYKLSHLNSPCKALPPCPHKSLRFAHLCNLYVWLIMWVCSSKVEAVLLAASVSFLSPVMLNPKRNSKRYKTSSCYKAIIQFWRLFKTNHGENNIDKKLLEACAKLFLTKL